MICLLNLTFTCYHYIFAYSKPECHSVPLEKKKKSITVRKEGISLFVWGQITPPFREHSVLESWNCRNETGPTGARSTQSRPGAAREYVFLTALPFSYQSGERKVGKWQAWSRQGVRLPHSSAIFLPFSPQTGVTLQIMIVLQFGAMQKGGCLPSSSCNIISLLFTLCKAYWGTKEDFFFCVFSQLLILNEFLFSSK